jgi:hypothetical protein
MRLPNQLVIIKFITPNAVGPIAAPNTQPTSSNVEINNAFPVILIKIEEIDVICGRYIVR